MESYRIYGLDRYGHIRFGDYVDSRDDDGAIAAAQRLLDQYAAAEVWFGRRKVADVRNADPGQV